MHPILGELKNEIKLRSSEAWFKNVDKDKDKCLNLEELTAYLKKLNLHTIKPILWEKLEKEA